MCPHCRCPLDDHEAAGGCLACSKVGHQCEGAAPFTIAISVLSGHGQVQVYMPAVTTAHYAARRAAEVLNLDPDACDWFLYDPIARRPLEDQALMATYDCRTLHLAWTEERRSYG